MRRALYLVLAVLVLVSSGSPAEAVKPSDGRRAAPEDAKAVKTVASTATDEPAGPLVLYWDEHREHLTRTPIPGAPIVVLSAAERRALSRSHAGLRVYAQADPGGGTTVDLAGRYQSVFVSLVDQSGRLRVICLDAEPGVQVRSAEPRGGSRAQ